MYFMLFILMLAAGGNYFFATRVFNKQQEDLSSQQLPPISGGTTYTTGPSPPPVPIREMELRGSIDARRVEGLHYIIKLSAFGVGNQPLLLKSFSADVRLPGSDKPTLTPVFQKTAVGTYEADVTLPNAGMWEVRARMIRENESLEFYERFDIPSQ